MCIDSDSRLQHLTACQSHLLGVLYAVGCELVNLGVCLYDDIALCGTAQHLSALTIGLNLRHDDSDTLRGEVIELLRWLSRR